MVSNGRTYFYHADTCGHILCLTDEQGNISASYAYDTFGNAIEETGSLAHNQPFTYCGLYGVMREGGGLYFMKRRYYDAVTGRFIQKDPIGIIGGLNVYTYAGNNPVTYMDPEGLMGPFAVLALGGLALLAAGGAAVSLMNNEMWKTFLNRHGGTEKYILAPHAEGAYERQMANNRENPQPYVKNDYWEGLKNEWNAILTTSPIGWETSAGGFGLSNTYSAVKAANDTVNGDGFDAGRNAAEAVPGPFGQVWNAINNWYDAWKADQDNKCQ
jgi:RHS repeat-associated protein